MTPEKFLQALPRDPDKSISMRRIAYKLREIDSLDDAIPRAVATKLRKVAHALRSRGDIRIYGTTRSTTYGRR